MAEPIQGTAIIVIQPGSLNLRLGRASDTYPHTIPHCIARRYKKPGSQVHYEDDWLVRPESIENSTVAAKQSQALRVAVETLQTRPTSTGQFRYLTSFERLAEINSQVDPEISHVPSPVQWSGTQHKPEYLVGEDALYINPKDTYNLHWPIRRGRFNLHRGIAGTLSAVVQDLETIWGKAIQRYLDIPLKDLKHYRAVLLIPDAYNRQHIREMMNMLLTRLGFGAAFAVQESVCATFGAGVSSACVVDIGDQKTSVSCVEDGISQKASRLFMEFGGSDITRCFHWLLQAAGFPYRSCSIASRMDALFLKELKETFCHLDQDLVGVEEQHVQIKRPGKNITKYHIHMGDERILAPMGVFYPDMFGLQGPGLCSVQERYKSDPGDHHDEDYLIQTMSRHEQSARLLAARKKENMEAANQNPDSIAMEDPQMDEDDTMDQPENLPPEQTGGSGKPVKKPWEEDDDCVDISKGLMGIDQAILKSIDKCDGEEMKKRMYSNIVVVGGGLAFAGAKAWLHSMVWVQMPALIRLTLESMEIHTMPKDLEPELACWKGGAVMAILDTTQELWIRQREWKKFGVRVLREKAPFVWL